MAAYRQTTQTTAVILAAGQGKRMKTQRPKVLTSVLGQEMLTYILDNLKAAGIDRPIVVVGYGGESVVELVGDNAVIAWQKEQLGTGHAVQMALPQLARIQGSVIVTNGDVPLISADFFRALVQERERTNAAAVVATMILDNPKAYGRIKRNAEGDIAEIVEMRDASPEEIKINEVNTGTYCFESRLLKEFIPKLKNDNAQGEYYLTDIIAHLIKAKQQVKCFVTPDPGEFMGINDPSDLVVVEQSLAQQIRQKHLSNGVIIENPETVRIEPHVTIGPRTRIRPGSIIEGYSKIGADCIVGPNVLVRNFQLPDNTHFTQSGLISKTIPK
ncbi:MAG: sugar phosphate nucleotidyltransferase [Sumerlaeia bacterium]